MPQLITKETFDEFYFWSAYLTLACNLECEYCIQSYGIESRSHLPKYEMVDGDTWIKGLNAVKHKPNRIVLQGGEPTLHPDCFDIIEELEGFGEIHLYSNLKFDVDALFARVKKNLPKLRILSSFHPERMTPEDVEEHARKLSVIREAGEDILVRNTMVDFPESRPHYEEYKAIMEKHGHHLDLLDFQGILDGKLYPEGCDEGFGLKQRKKVWCQCKQVNIAPDGSLYNCATRVYRKDKVSYGNLFRDGLSKFPIGYVKCSDYGMCNPCTATRVKAYNRTTTNQGVEKAMYGVGLVGCGYMSIWHINGWNAAPNANILATADLEEARAKERATRVKGDWYTDYKQLFDRDDIQAMSVCLPHDIRADIVCDILEHGRHVLMEKPAAPSMEEARRMQEAADRAGKILMVAENWRYNPVTIEARKIIESGEIGEPFQAYAHLEFMESFQPHQLEWHSNKQRSGGGVLIDSGVHMVSVLRMLMGEFQSVSAIAGKQVWDELAPCEDNLGMSFLFKSGATGVASLAWRGKRKNFHSPFTIMGTEGILEFNFQGGINPTHTIELTFGNEKRKSVEVKSSESMGIQEQTRAFLECIESGEQPETSLREEMKSVLVAKAAYESIEKKAWVDVPEIDF